MSEYASIEEVKGEPSFDEPPTYNAMVEKEFTPMFRGAYAKVLARLTVKKTDCNTFG